MSKFLFFIVFGLCYTICNAYTISDNVLFDLNWPGPHTGLKQSTNDDDANSIVMTTTNNEKYRCILPDGGMGMSKEEQIEAYMGPSEYELIEPLFKQTTCSYRLESYWTYELCHGRFLRQYHEDKELGKKAKLQEYMLGKYVIKKNDDDDKQSDSDSEEKEVIEEVTPKKKIPVLKVEGIELPYFEVPFDDGTACDLTGSPRRAFIRYVCQPEGKGEIYEFKEIATCEYALVVLTSVLCSHPAFETKKGPINEIKCHSMEDSPRRPISLANLEMENSKGQYNRRESTVLPKKPERTVKERVVVDKKVETPISAATDRQLLNDFLAGDYCIQGGGSGWWKHEFCFGKKVTQYHEEKNGKRVDVLLGIWDKEDHMKWLEKYPAKQPKPKDTRKFLAYYYGTGDICDLTGKRRFTEVKLKCKENTKQPHAMSIYLVEPNSCEYLLVVESAIFCDLLKQGDDVSGLIPLPSRP